MDGNIGPYRTLIVSRIPAVESNGIFRTQSLWGVDINANADVTNGLWLVCPVTPFDDAATEPIDKRVKIMDSLGLNNKRFEAIIKQCDAIEISGNFDWSGASMGRRAMRLANKNGKLTILGISSNRAKTVTMNAAGLPLPSRIRAMAKSASIRMSQRYLARNCDAVRVVGKGLVPLVSEQAKVLRVEVASWIRESDIKRPRDGQFDPVSIIIASRLEPMKGVSMGLEAVARLFKGKPNLALSIIGVVPLSCRAVLRLQRSGFDAVIATS